MVFEVADYESDVKNPHFKMADTIRRAKLSKRLNLLELVIHVFSMSLIKNPMSNIQNLKCRM